MHFILLMLWRWMLIVTIFILIFHHPLDINSNEETDFHDFEAHGSKILENIINTVYSNI